MLLLTVCAHACAQERRKKTRHGRESEMEREVMDIIWPASQSHFHLSFIFI